MDNIKVAFWNLGNLFDTSSSSLIGSDLEFTPERGWDDAAKDKKIENLVRVINSLHDNQGPDLLGLCEIENEELAKKLIEKMGKQDIYEIAQYVDSPDTRGIDTCLIYSKKIFKFIDAKSHNIYFRYPTRDIFQANLSVINNNNSELNVLVNHWPSRIGGRFETEPLRIAVAENCARAVEGVLKVSLDYLKEMPNNLKGNEESLNKLNQKWNKNVLVMGDLNDNPFDRSILNYLQATPDKNRLIEWKEIFEHPSLKKWPANQQTDKHNYLYQPAFLYNCMWKLIPDGTLFYEGGLDLFDQFIISRGLLNGEQGLKMDLNEIKIDKSTKIANHIPAGNFDPTGQKNKIHPILKESPMSFEYIKKKANGEPENLPAGRDPLTGFSDHFPIQAVINAI
ncbi:MAG: hypothetical protein M3250_08510 [Thermoproteota archaeon]|nr:hypothetical protein [Thermoproteota archaeon]